MLPLDPSVQYPLDPLDSSVQYRGAGLISSTVDDIFGASFFSVQIDFYNGV